MVTNRHGTEVPYLLAICFMDDDIVDYLAEKFSPCSDQKFFNEYEEEYLRRFGTEWVMSRQKIGGYRYKELARV